MEADENRTLYLIPTSEVPLTALHGGEVLPASQLPLRYTAFSPCYRREAGTYGKDMKGIFRQHQFDKVELVKVATPAQAPAELESMVGDAEEVLQAPGPALQGRGALHRRPGVQHGQGLRYRSVATRAGHVPEISSCSNYDAFGGRRADIRYRPTSGGRPEPCATLNGSGLAVGRTLIAILENYQEADGTVVIPPALRPYVDGLDRLTVNR